MASACAALLLTSCVSVDVGRDYSVEHISSLRIGETTKAEVLQKLGSPLTSIIVADSKYRHVHFGDERTVHIWRYISIHGNMLGTKGKGLQIEFDSAGKVVDYVLENSAASVEAQHNKARDFDLIKARDRIVPGQTTKAEVFSLLGTNCMTEAFNQTGVTERIRYAYLEMSKDEWTYDYGAKVRKVYTKSLSLLIDAEARVLAAKGESDFPEDLNRQQAERAR
ncbi:MAG: hypothetical protein RLY20_3006 [Verrucomicrobiota bacterium]|jgi:outer membrane protein assembly factor BamE (lipoprotein component of BamABCDE complex)